MNKDQAWEYQLGDITVRYIHRDGIAFELIPSGTRQLIKEHRLFLTGAAVENLALKMPLPATYSRDNLVQIKVMNEPYRDGFSGGITLFDSLSTEALRFESREVIRTADRQDIQTVLRHPNGLRCVHHVLYRDGESTIDIFSEVTNESDNPITLELLSSFVLSGITPFDDTDAAGRLKLHRFRSWWSAEGRLESRTLEELHLERPWITQGARSERFGQIGSMPVRRFFPFVAVEDTIAGVVWGAKLAWAGSWQIEAIRRGDTLTLTGGHADREFGHWRKMLIPGETLTSPMAMLTSLKGSLDDLCQRFLKTEEALIPSVESEESLPVIFNEWCSSWGSPTSENVLEVADRLKDLPVKYFVIDDGWAERPAGAQMQSNGDWIEDRVKFPDGLGAVADALMKRGLIPGLWFEFEVCNSGSKAWEQTSHHLHRDGCVLQAGNRRFWNFCDPWVRDYLSERVIGLLRNSGFRFLKVDYNDTIGIGCDHPDSLGEGLRLQVLAVQEFFKKLRRELPDLVIENCSSGGHRLEPSMMQLASMGSFSDAQEGVEIPIIAGNLQRLIPPRQSQIWAVLRKRDSAQRLVYSLTAGCLGRLCLSGDICSLSAEQMQVVKDGLAFYEAAAPIIKSGRSEFFGDIPQSYNHPEGWQAVVRYSDTGNEALIVTHSFQTGSAREIGIPLAPGVWAVKQEFVHDVAGETCCEDRLLIRLEGSFVGKAYLLRKK